MTNHTVSNASQLETALSKASGGDTILLAKGNYGSFTFEGLKFNSNVTIKPSGADLSAVFSTIAVNNSSHLVFNGLHVDKPTNSGRFVVEIRNSDDITFKNGEVNGNVDNVTPIIGPASGIHVLDGSSSITLENNYVHDVLRGIKVYRSDDVIVRGNNTEFIGEDAFFFSNLNGALIEGNFGPKKFYFAGGAHTDFMQFGSGGKDIVVRSNVLLLEDTFSIQGIFMAAGTYNNVLIENNLLYTGMYNGIYVSDGSGIAVRNNTLINVPGYNSEATMIRLLSGGSSSNNIVTSKIGEDRGSNIVAQYRDSKGDNYIGDLFKNGTSFSVDQLTKVFDQFGSKGAYKVLDALNSGSLSSLLGSGSGTTSGSSNDAPNEPADTSTQEPTPTPRESTSSGSGSTSADGTVVYQKLGDHEFSSASDIIRVKDNASLKLAEGTLAFSFEADSVGDMYALVSAAGSSAFQSWVNGGKLYATFKDGSETDRFVFNGIKANTEYDVEATFDGDQVALYVNDKLVGRETFGGDWSGGVDLTIGGFNYTNNSSFDGTISDVMVLSGSGGSGSTTSGSTSSGSTKAGSGPSSTTSSGSNSTSADGTIVYQKLGDHEFSSASDIIRVKDNVNLKLAEGTLAFSFDADNVGSMNALVSAAGSSAFQSWVNDGKFFATFKDGSETDRFVFNGIKANTEYDVEATFDGDQVALYVNDKLVGRETFGGDWSGGVDLTIGGFNFTDNFSFDGTISDVMVFA